MYRSGDLAAFPRCVRAAGVTLLFAFLALLLVPTEYLPAQKIIYDGLTLLTAGWILVAAGLLLRYRGKLPISISVLLALFVVVPLLLTLGGLRWLLFVRVPAHVYVDQQRVEGARVHRGTGGKMLITLDESTMHLYLPGVNEIMMCDSYLFHDYGLVGRLEKGRDEYFCMSSEKQEIELDLRAQGRNISFNRPNGRELQRVTVTP